jgi:hypothetical protein
MPKHSCKDTQLPQLFVLLSSHSCHIFSQLSSKRSHSLSVLPWLSNVSELHAAVFIVDMPLLSHLSYLVIHNELNFHRLNFFLSCATVFRSCQCTVCGFLSSGAAECSRHSCHIRISSHSCEVEAARDSCGVE